MCKLPFAVGRQIGAFIRSKSLLTKLSFRRTRCTYMKMRSCAYCDAWHRLRHRFGLRLTTLISKLRLYNIPHRMPLFSTNLQLFHTKTLDSTTFGRTRKKEHTTAHEHTVQPVLSKFDTAANYSSASSDTGMACKRTSRSSAPPSRRQKLDDSSSQQVTAPCYFLQLPAELHNEIYAHVCGGKREKAFLKAHNRGNLVYKSPLALLNKQIRREALPIVYMAVPRIEVRVKDFNFAHVVAFFNKCDDRELQTLPGTGTASGTQRKVMVTVEITDSTPNCMDGLRCWVKRAAQPEKQGSTVSMQYQMAAGPNVETFCVFNAIAKMKNVTEDVRQAQVLTSILRVDRPRHWADSVW